MRRYLQNVRETYAVSVVRNLLFLPRPASSDSRTKKRSRHQCELASWVVRSKGCSAEAVGWPPTFQALCPADLYDVGHLHQDDGIRAARSKSTTLIRNGETVLKGLLSVWVRDKLSSSSKIQ